MEYIEQRIVKSNKNEYLGEKTSKNIAQTVFVIVFELPSRLISDIQQMNFDADTFSKKVYR